MIVIDCEQGSREWFAARAGVCTASMFRVARTYKATTGEPTDAMLNYAFRLAIERESGEPMEGSFETWQMKRGKELEVDARIRHQAEIGVVVQQSGLILTDDRKFGGSPDGLIGHAGGSEYKCLVSEAELRATILDNDLSTFIDQVQGNLWLHHREWWDFCIYCPFMSAFGREFSRWRIQRDDTYIEAMVADLMKFDTIVEHYRERLRREI